MNKTEEVFLEITDKDKAQLDAGILREKLRNSTCIKEVHAMSLIFNVSER